MQLQAAGKNFLLYLNKMGFYRISVSALQEITINYSLFMSMPLIILQTSFTSISHFFPLQGTRSTVCLITSGRHSTLSIILADFCIKKAAESKTARGTRGIFIKQPNSFILFSLLFSYLSF